ncbi:putative oxidoreductase C-terminal domain-containing protein [Ilyomonas limi]|uniref:putative oxidoreductase C-terminal domain-containing protein n=1 Tax=Ilyomonas limi TaxID=2575867 RepID=UPI001F10672A|nr:putative oxidoreductase C-terminal domain-containing protein [Ilyomonas limi]
MKATTDTSTLVHLITLAPGHFHAALLQKSMYREVDSTVYVFAPEGQEVQAHLALINEYNNRKENPTAWKEKVYTGKDYLEQMIQTKPGNIVVIAGNNQMKTEYINRCIDAGLNVLADKPMAISTTDFDQLKNAFAAADKKKILLYDIMTERYEITNILQKAFAQLPDVFGHLQKGTLKDPAITSASIHYFFKDVSGVRLIRPSWYFDVNQEGEGIVDVTTHLVDLIQWQCFPDVVLDYKKDIKMLSAKHWPTVLTPSQFYEVTKKDTYPDFLQKVVKDSLLSVYANGEMNYTIKDIHATISVVWNFKAADGGGDTYYSVLKGTKANLIIRQGKEQQYKPSLYIEPVDKSPKPWNEAVQAGLRELSKRYPGIHLQQSNNGWEVIIPGNYKTGHEQHFSRVVKNYIQCLNEGNMPHWEVAGMLAKYYTTTQALEKAINNKQ